MEKLISLMVQDESRNRVILGYSIMKDLTIRSAIEKILKIVDPDEQLDINDDSMVIAAADLIFQYISAIN